MKFYVSRKVESDSLMVECKRFIVIWKELDEVVVWYEKFLYGVWYKGVLEVVGMISKY